MKVAILGGEQLSAILARMVTSQEAEAEVWYLGARERSTSAAAGFPPGVQHASDYRFLDNGSWTILVNVPSTRVEATLERLTDSLPRGRSHRIAIFSKGIASLEGRRRHGALTYGEITEALAKKRAINVTTVAVGGPSLLGEIQEAAHTFLVMGSTDPDAADQIGRLLDPDVVHYSITDDARGVELGGALKNPIAMAAGIVAGLPNSGGNLIGELVAVGFREMMAIGTALGAKPETLLGRAGLADLMANAFSYRSRNRSFGRQFVERVQTRVDEPGLLEKLSTMFRPGTAIERELSRTDLLAEGGYALASVLELATELGIQTPLYSALHSVLARRTSPEKFLSLLTGERPLIHATAPGNPGTVTSKTKSQKPEDDPIRRIAGIVYHRFRTSVDAADLFRRAASELVGAEAEQPSAFRVLNATGEDFWDACTQLTQIYTVDAARRFAFAESHTAPGVLAETNAAFAPNVSGPADAVRKLAARKTIVYAANHCSHLDPVEVSIGAASLQLPVPIFPLVHTDADGPLWEWVVKSVGGSILRLQAARNPIYMACVREHWKHLISAGRPSLLFPEGRRSRSGSQQAIHAGLLQILFECLQESGRDIAVVPVTLSYEIVPEDKELCGEAATTPFTDFINRRMGVHMVIADPISVSTLSHEENPECVLAARIGLAWQKQMRVLPHHLVSRVLSENGGQMTEKTLLLQLERFMDAHKGNYAVKSGRLNLSDGIRSLLERDIIGLDGPKVVTRNKNLLEFYAGAVITEEQLI